MKAPRPWDEPDPDLARIASAAPTFTLRTSRERDRLAAQAAGDQMNMEDPDDAQS